MNSRNSAVQITISLIITLGFILSGASSFFSFQMLFKNDIEAVSELTSENIYSNINNLMDRPINVSIAMAHDTFLRDFMDTEQIDGLQETSLKRIKEYLASYQKKYQFTSVFFVSSKTGAYYHYQNGLDRTMTPDNPENQWYYEFLEDSADCSLNVDNDEAKNDIITIFVNCKLFDEEQNLLGVVGVGLETPYIQQFLVEKELDYAIHAFLIDRSGRIQLSSNATEFEQINLFEDEAYQDMAESIQFSTTEPTKRWYHKNGIDGYVITKYVPNLNWYLVVEKNANDFKSKMLSHLGASMIFLLLVLLVVVKITTNIIKQYNQKLTRLAETDSLTGIKNRYGYEREIAQCALNLDKYQSFGIGIFDLNNLKGVNDQYGHQTGDRYLKGFAKMLCDEFARCSVFRIGGDEFVVIFQDLPEETVQAYWHQLLEKIKAEKRSNTPDISVAFG